MRDLVDTCAPLKASTFCDCVSIDVDVDHVLALLHGLVLRRLEHLVEGQATLVAAAHHVDVSIADPVGVATRRQTPWSMRIRCSFWYTGFLMCGIDDAWPRWSMQYQAMMCAEPLVPCDVP